MRLAALSHDLGHPPFSHAVEFAMPLLAALPLRPEHGGEQDRQATHEDYTLLLLTESALTTVIDQEFDFTASHVASLISGAVHAPDDFFEEAGCDLRPLLSQLISSELDVDRMDYLVRDSTFTGAKYGEVDSGWLLSHLTRHVDSEDRVCLALDGRALYAFDDFLLSRFHMFMMVYFHQKSVVYEEMLKRSLATRSPVWTLPGDVEGYLRTDDAMLWGLLRDNSDPWANRILRFDPYKVALEVHGTSEEAALKQRTEHLKREGIDAIARSECSRAQRPPKPGAPDVYVVDQPRGGAQRVLRLQDAKRALRRDQLVASISRIYVPPEDLGRARAVLAGAWQQPELLWNPRR